MKFAVSIENKIRGDSAKWNDVGSVPGGGATLSNVCMHELMNCIKDKMKNDDRIDRQTVKIKVKVSKLKRKAEKKSDGKKIKRPAESLGSANETDDEEGDAVEKASDKAFDVFWDKMRDALIQELGAKYERKKEDVKQAFNQLRLLVQTADFQVRVLPVLQDRMVHTSSRPLDCNRVATKRCLSRARSTPWTRSFGHRP